MLTKQTTYLKNKLRKIRPNMISGRWCFFATTLKKSELVKANGITYTPNGQWAICFKDTIYVITYQQGSNYNFCINF